jgi:hypothetical protein
MDIGALQGTLWEATEADGGYMELKLTLAEGELLREMVAHYLRDLRLEIARTENKDFRIRLRGQEQLLDRLLAELERLDLPVAGIA